MESDPQHPEWQPAAKEAEAKRQRGTAGPGQFAESVRGKSYTAKPEFTKEDGNQDKRKRGSRWLLITLVAATLAVSGLLWKQDSLPHWIHPWSTAQHEQILTLTPADIDYAATEAARAALSRGEIPPVLANADAETRRKILSGEENLYTKRLLDQNQQRGILVHARVSTGGVFLGEDLLTAERPQGTTFPAGPGAPTHFHFTVEQAGPNGVVTCYVNSITGATASTRPMAAGESGDLEVIAR